MATQTLPTNRKNELYYGPKTLAQAKKMITDGDFSNAEIRALISRMAENGYTRAAAAVRREYFG